MKGGIWRTWWLRLFLAAALVLHPSCGLSGFHVRFHRLQMEDSQRHPKPELSSAQTHTLLRREFLHFSSASLAATTWLSHKTKAAASTIPRAGMAAKLHDSAVSSVSGVAAPTTRLQEAVGGAISGSILSLTKVLVKHPLDTITVRLQTEKNSPGNTAPAISSMDRDLSVSRRELLSFTELFRGIIPPLVFAVPSGAVFFGVKDFTKATLVDAATGDLGGFLPWLSLLQVLGSREGSTLVSVFVAQFPYWAVRNPGELIKTRAQANLYTSTGNSTKNVVELARIAVSEEGAGALWRGYGENIAYAYPADALKFVIYETLTQARQTTKVATEKRRKVPPLEGAIAGALATCIAQVITTPLDLVRNRVMAQTTVGSEELENSGTNRRKTSYVDALVEIAQKEGVPALWTGTLPRVGKAIISGAVQFGSYELSKSSISDFFSQKSLSSSEQRKI